MANYSFDIFDTLISRKFANDKGVLLALREQLRQVNNQRYPHFFVDEFVGLRIEAQRQAHKISSYVEITLDEIYSVLITQFPDIEEEHIRQLQEMEELIEIENCYAIPENVNRVLELIESNNEVVLISDMYLSKSVIQRMLVHANKRLSLLPLYVSSELKLRKSDGDLFDFVIDDLNIKPSSLIHTGDNFHSDCLMAEKKGIRSSYYNSSHLTTIEKSFFIDNENFFLQLVTGVSKRIRLKGYNLKPSYNLGGSFMAPMFYGFVFNLLQKAARDGIKNVYFLARDAYLFKIIADEIKAYLDIDISIHYLYVSRKSIYLASIFRVTDNCFEWIFQEMDNFITFNRISSRLNFDKESLLKYLEDDLADLIRNHGLDNRLTIFLKEELKNEILNNVVLRKKIESKAQDYRSTVVEYFEQEGVLEPDRVAFVDIGWRGTLQDAIFRILNSKKSNFKLTGYYFAVINFSTFTSNKNKKEPAFIFPSIRAGYGPIIESFTLCDHGTTLGYRKDSVGKVHPILKSPLKPGQEWDAESYKDGIKDFSRYLSSLLSKYQNIGFNFEAITPILLEKLKDATPKVANILGDLYYSGDIEETNIRRFAPSFNKRQALHYVFSSKKVRDNYTKWFEGSYSRSRVLSKVILDLDPRRLIISITKYFIKRESLLAYFWQLKQNLKLIKMRYLRR